MRKGWGYIRRLDARLIDAYKRIKELEKALGDILEDAGSTVNTGGWTTSGVVDEALLAAAQKVLEEANDEPA